MKISRMHSSIILPLLIGLSYSCPVYIPLEADNWTAVYPIGEIVVNFCNQTMTTVDCPVIPPDQPEYWIQMLTIYPGKNELTFFFPPKCHYNNFTIHLQDVYAEVDTNSTQRQNGTFIISLDKVSKSYPLNNGWGWKNISLSIGEYQRADHLSKLRLTLKLENTIIRKMSRVVVGGITVV